MEINIALREMQTKFIKSDKRFKIVIADYDSGKSYGAFLNIFIHSQENANSLNVIVVPRFSFLKNTMYTLIDEIIPKDCIESFNRTDRELKFKNGSKIIFRSGYSKQSIEGMRGMSISSFWIDEKYPIDESIWNNLIGMLRQKGMTRLGIVTSNIEHGWVYEKFYINKDNLSDDFLVINTY